MRAERLHEKVMAEADRAYEVKYEKQTEEIIRRNMTKPESKIQQHRKTLAATVHKRSLVETELKLQQEIAVQSERLTKAALALKEANLTAEEKRKRDAETPTGCHSLLALVW